MKSIERQAASPSSSHPSWIAVDIAQFKENIAAIRAAVTSARLCLPIKANAYGHGLCPIGLAAQSAGVDYLAVAHLEEGVRLRQGGITLPILVLGAIHEEQIEEFVHFDLEFTISSLFKAQLVAKKIGPLGKRAVVHLEVDTGMHRTGVRPLTALDVIRYLDQSNCFDLVGIYTHLATAEEDAEYAEQQYVDFMNLLNHPLLQGRDVIRHLANSEAVVKFPHMHLDMVRPSLLAFGYTRQPFPVQPCFALKARVSYFKVVEAGRGISYGHSYITQQQSRIATIPVGYGDGYRRALSNRGSVLIRGKRYPIVGAICMDQCMVNVGNGEAFVGDEAVLIGRQGNEEISLAEVAHLCDTIPYEILSAFNERLPRVYTHTNIGEQPPPPKEVSTTAPL